MKMKVCGVFNLFFLLNPPEIWHKIIYIMDFYRMLIEKTLIDVEKSMKDYMKHRPNLSYEVETLVKGNYIFILAHCATDDNKSFSCAYLKACFDLGQNKFIHYNQNVLDKKHYTMEDTLKDVKNYVAMLVKDFLNF